MIRSALMNVMTGAALKAGRGLKRDFGEVENLQVSVKGPGDFVTAADKKAEKTLLKNYQRRALAMALSWKKAALLREAIKVILGTLILLTGRQIFFTACPIFAISIALEREGQLIAGVVYNPAIDEMYIAEKGQGAYFNNRRMRVAARRGLAECMVACGIPPLARHKDHDAFKKELAAAMNKIGNIRRLGAAAIDLAMVACGRFDGYWERGVNSWDIAAGIVLVREAGGFVTDLSGATSMLAKGEICAGNEMVHRQLLEVMRKS